MSEKFKSGMQNQEQKLGITLRNEHMCEIRDNKHIISMPMKYNIVKNQCVVNVTPLALTHMLLNVDTYLAKGNVYRNI